MSSCSRKRPRRVLEEEASKNNDDDEKHLISPHAQRLLVLVQQGTASHAQLAASHLTDIAARSSPVILWDLVGRLAAMLLLQESNSSNARFALQGVAQQLPRVHQESFLRDSTVPSYHTSDDDDDAGSDVLWLSVETLDIKAVLQHGRVLYGSPESDYDNDEDELQNSLLRASTDNDDYCQQRIRMQRRILAKRLGLGGLLKATDNNGDGGVISDLLPSEISSNDLLQSTQEPEATASSSVVAAVGSVNDKKQQAEKNNNNNNMSLRAIMVQQLEKQDSTAELVSHDTPQQLLATDFLYRMFDPHWYIRQGALLGLLALLQAWSRTSTENNTESSSSAAASFGAWPRDILARCVCLLALDKYCDYNNGSAVVAVAAPVRQVAAHVIALLYRMAPCQTRCNCRTMLLQLANNNTTDEWEVRHGAWLALLSCRVAVVVEDDTTAVGDVVLQAAIQALSDNADDVVAVAAQWLLLHHQQQREQSPVQQQASSPPALIQSIYKALLRVESSVMASAVPVVQLFASVIQQQQAAVGVEHQCVVWNKLATFLTFPSSSIQISTLQAISTMLLSRQQQDSTTTHHDSSSASSFCNLVRQVFSLHWEQFDYMDDNNRALKQLTTARDEAWTQIVSNNRVQEERLLVTSLVQRLVQQPQQQGTPPLNCQYSACRAVAQFMVQMQQCQVYCQTVITALLHSPRVSHCETASLLYRALCEHGAASWVCGLDLMLTTTIQLPLHANGNADVLIGEIHSIIEAKSWHKSSTMETTLLEGLKRNTMHPAPTDKPTVAGMRIASLVAGALVAGNHLPPKLTPLIRAIMTSLKSETDSKYMHFTCTDLVGLLQLLAMGKENIRDKVLTNICRLSDENDDKTGTPTKSAAKKVVQGVVRNLPEGKTIQDLPPIWQRVKPLSSSDPSKAESSLSDALHMMLIVSNAVEKGSETTVHLISITIPCLILTACVSPDASHRSLANACIKALAKADASLLLTKAIPLLSQHLQDKVNDSVRVGACKLMHSIMEEVDMEVCPFVRYLLPIAMSLMTDPMEDCAKEASKTFADLVRVAPLVTEVASIDFSLNTMDRHAQSVMDHLIHGEPLPPCILPESIQSDLATNGISLRPYQAEGIAWLRFLQTVRLNGALCDSMGLGKTLQALVAVALAHADTKGEAAASPRSLVVCPSSVVGHWEAEIRKFFPTRLKPLALVGNHTQRKKLWNSKKENASIVVTSYAALRNEIEKLREPLWEYCILDEGHLLKNPKTATAIAARRIRSNHRLILTGTPVQNRVGELWATFDFLMPNFLGSHSHFSKTYANPIGKGQAPGASADAIKTSMDKLKNLHQQVLPFILRREKEQVLKELPPKCITDIPCSLTSEQSTLYKSFCATSHVKQSISSLENLVESNEKVKLGENVLKSLLYLRLLCTHPALVEKKQNAAKLDPATQLKRSGKLMVLKDLLHTAGVVPDELSAADNDASAFYLDTDGGVEDAYSESLRDGNDVPLAPTSTRSSPSKTKCLIFAQFMHSLDVVADYLFQAHMPSLRFLRLDGSVPSEKRTAIVDAFNKDDSIQVLLLTTRVGGLGLNLTGASMVVLLEHDYNPFADLQAMDRAHRIGQNKTVHVYRLISSDSIEEKVMMIQAAKIRMSNAIVNSENSSMYSMGTDRLLDIFTFRSEDAVSKKSRSPFHEMDKLMNDYDEEYHSLSIQEFAKSFVKKA